jgi:hypothetical protein
MEEKQKLLIPLRKDVNEKQSRLDVVESEIQFCMSLVVAYFIVYSLD